MTISPQLRILKALILREIHTLYGDSRLGYLWAVIQTAFGIAVFWGLRHFMHAANPHGMTILSFLAVGFGIWNIITQTLTKCMNAVEGNRPLLTFPQVFPLDVMISRAVVVFATQIVSMSIILGLGALAGYPVILGDSGALLAALALSFLLGLGLGTFFASLAVYLPALHFLVPIVLRVLFFASGVFFSVTAFASRVGDFLLWNPIMQLIELTRHALSGSYPATDVDMPYLCMITGIFLAVGLLLERFVRRRSEL